MGIKKATDTLHSAMARGGVGPADVFASSLGFIVTVSQEHADRCASWLSKAGTIRRIDNLGDRVKITGAW